MKKIYSIVLVILLMSCFSIGECNNSSLQNNVSMMVPESLYKDIKTLVEHFCLTEYRGSTLNLYLPGYPSLTRRKAKIKQEVRSTIDEYDQRYEYFDIYPLYIVDSYKIEEIKQLDETHAYAVISYHQLATRGESWEKIKAQQGAYTGTPIKNIQDIKSKLNLEYDGTRWWIIDPPEPKVSFESMANYYRDGAKAEYDRMVGKRIDYKYAPEDIEQFKKRYEAVKDILNILVTLKNDPVMQKKLFSFEEPDTEKRVQAHLTYIQNTYIGKELKDLVEKFCREEYLGTRWNYVNPDHHPAAKYSPKIREQINEIMDSINRDDYYEIDPISIVDNYKIEEIKQIDSTHAYVIVSYCQLAVRGESWEEIKVKGKNYQGMPKKDVRYIKAKLNLEHDGKRWWIVDPPVPKISYETILKYYKHNITFFKNRLDKITAEKSFNEDKKLIQREYKHQHAIYKILINLNEYRTDKNK